MGINFLKRIKIPAKGLFLALILICSILGLLLFFGYGFDVERKMVDFPLFILALPFAVPFLIFAILDTFVTRASPLASNPPARYRLIVWIAFGVEMLSLVVGGILLGLQIGGIIADENPNFPLLLESILIFPGQIVYLAMVTFFSIVEKNKMAILGYGVAFALTLAGFLTGTIAMKDLGFGFGVFYLAGPVSLIIVLAFGRDDLAEPRKQVE